MCIQSEPFHLHGDHAKIRPWYRKLPAVCNSRHNEGKGWNTVIICSFWFMTSSLNLFLGGGRGALYQSDYNEFPLILESSCSRLELGRDMTHESSPHLQLRVALINIQDQWNHKSFCFLQFVTTKRCTIYFDVFFPKMHHRVGVLCGMVVLPQGYWVRNETFDKSKCGWAQQRGVIHFELRRHGATLDSLCVFGQIVTKVLFQLSLLQQKSNLVWVIGNWSSPFLKDVIIFAP